MRLGRFTEANEAFSLILEATSSHFYGAPNLKITNYFLVSLYTNLLTSDIDRIYIDIRLGSRED